MRHLFAPEAPLVCEDRVMGSRRCAVAAVTLAWVWITGCAGTPDPPELCLEIGASPNLNLFDGQPHAVVLYLYPLQNVSAFQASDPRSMLNGARPPGMTGERWEATVLPGEQREIREQLPRDTGSVGVIADFYTGPSAAVVEVGCGMFGGAEVVLSASDLQRR